MKMKLKMLILIVFILSVILPYKCTYATTSVGDIFRQADEEFLGAGSIEGTIKEDKLKETSKVLFKTLTIIGIVIMVLVGTIIGIKFMIASVEDKAKIKEALVPYIIGCAVILGAFTIWSIAVNIGQSVFPTPSGDSTTHTSSSEAEHGGIGGKF